MARKYFTTGCIYYLTSALVVSTAWAAFGPAFTLSSASRNGFEPQVALDAAGNAIAVWMHSDGENSTIQARKRSAGGVLGDVQDISAADKVVTTPRVAVAPDGDAVIAWLFYNGTNLRLQARARSKTGALSSIQNISPAGEFAFLPKVAIAPDGDALLVWQVLDGSNSRIKARTLSAAGTLGSILNVSAVGTVIDPDVAMDQDGNALIVWYGNPKIMARSVSAAGALGTVRKVTDFGQTPKVAMNTDGDAFIVWKAMGIDGRAYTKAGKLKPVQTFNGPSSSPFDPQVGMDAAGDAVVVWANGVNGSIQIELRERKTTAT